MHCLLGLAISWHMFYIQFVYGRAIYIMGNLNYVHYFVMGGEMAVYLYCVESSWITV